MRKGKPYPTWGCSWGEEIGITMVITPTIWYLVAWVWKAQIEEYAQQEVQEDSGPLS